MSLSKQLVTNIEEVLKKTLRRRFQDYKPEPGVMPFHAKLLGKDRMALFSFIHLLNTNFGITVFEPVAVYRDLLDCFERVGIELRPEIDAYFEKHTKY